MFRELRSLLQMLDTLDVEIDADEDEDAVEAEAGADDAAAPAGLVAGARPARPFSLILDPDEKSSGALQAMLLEAGVEAETHKTLESFRQSLAGQGAHFTFLDTGEQCDLVLDTLIEMGSMGYDGPVQLMGTVPMAAMGVVQRLGERQSLSMLAPLPKPLETKTVRALMRAHNLGPPPTPKGETTLDVALENNWVEFWYQPKIDLAKRRIAGVECFARVRHPELGTLPPAQFMAGASDESIMLLAQRSVEAALAAARNFCQLGVSLRVAVNMPVKALLTLPIADMVLLTGPKNRRWPGMILDVTEAQVATDIEGVMAAAAVLSQLQVHLALDDFGEGALTAEQLATLPFAELKLDRRLVGGAHADEAKARSCGAMINLAHRLGSVAVAIGIERGEDLRLLTSLGCDLGQGYFFGQPMPEEQLVAQLTRRAVVPQRLAATAALAGSAEATGKDAALHRA